MVFVAARHTSPQQTVYYQCRARPPCRAPPVSELDTGVEPYGYGDVYNTLC